MIKTRHIFISHSWTYYEQYEKVKEFLENAPRFNFINHSVPKDNPIPNTPVDFISPSIFPDIKNPLSFLAQDNPAQNTPNMAVELISPPLFPDTKNPFSFLAQDNPAQNTPNMAVELTSPPLFPDTKNPFSFLAQDNPAQNTPNMAVELTSPPLFSDIKNPFSFLAQDNSIQNTPNMAVDLASPPIGSINATDIFLQHAIENKINKSDVVLIIAGVYASYSKWINIEIDIAKSYSKPILAIQPWGAERTSTTSINAADRVVKWNTDSIVEAIRKLVP